MKWTDKKNGEHWTSGKYEIKLGKNSIPKAKSFPVSMDDVFHCYHDSKYIAQSDTLETAKKECEKHESKTKNP
jgi:hypothetical protein